MTTENQAIPPPDEHPGRLTDAEIDELAGREDCPEYRNNDTEIRCGSHCRPPFQSQLWKRCQGVPDEPLGNEWKPNEPGPHCKFFCW